MARFQSVEIPIEEIFPTATVWSTNREGGWRVVQRVVVSDQKVVAAKEDKFVDYNYDLFTSDGAIITGGRTGKMVSVLYRMKDES